MFRRYSEDPVARAMMQQHAEICRVDKEDLKRSQRELRENLDAKHGENQKELGTIKRLIYIAVGAALAFNFLTQHGAEVLKVMAH